MICYKKYQQPYELNYYLRIDVVLIEILKYYVVIMRYLRVIYFCVKQ